MAEMCGTLEKVIQNLRDGIICMEMMDSDDVTNEHVDHAGTLITVAGTHIHGTRDMIKRFKNFLPKKE
jgi:hypothetical protein